MADSRRLLFISYAFPPTGGGGVQRSVKFTKYLPEFGWRPTVLTAANPSVPVHDDDLLRDVCPSTNVLRARTLEPGYSVKRKLVAAKTSRRASIRSTVRQVGMSLLQPDPQVLWNPIAYRAAAAEIQQSKLEAIYVTGPPFSSFLLGRKLKKRFGLPLVIDFRDEWLLASQYLDNHQRAGIAAGRQQLMMNKTLRVADAVIATTQSSAEELARYVHQVGSRAATTCIYNGYDEDDLATVCKTDHQSNRLRIVYTGTLWRLTDIAPVVSALQRLEQIDPKLTCRVDLVLAGRRTPTQDAALRRLDSTSVSLHCHDYLPHSQSLELAATADVLLLLLADAPGAERVVPAKLFEYMALGKPILAVCGEGETLHLLRAHGHTHHFLPHRTDEIACWLDGWSSRVLRRVVIDSSIHLFPVIRLNDSRGES